MEPILLSTSSSLPAFMASNCFFLELHNHRQGGRVRNPFALQGHEKQNHEPKLTSTIEK